VTLDDAELVMLTRIDRQLQRLDAALQMARIHGNGDGALSISAERQKWETARRGVETAADMWRTGRALPNMAACTKVKR
jgi:hypothetical protein